MRSAHVTRTCEAPVSEVHVPTAQLARRRRPPRRLSLAATRPREGDVRSTTVNVRDDIFEPRGGLRVRLELWLLGLLLKTEHMRKPNSED
jgi:hypothetical protein